MKLNNKELQLLYTLMMTPQWKTSKELAQELDVNEKKIQKAIKILDDKLEGKGHIISHLRKGYKMDGLLQDFKDELFFEYEFNESFFNLNDRSATIALYLLFQKEYITMNELAEKFYLSKTTVFSEIKKLKQWMDETEGLYLEVSRIKGVKIYGDERVKRYEGSCFSQFDSLYHLLNEEEIIFYKENFKICYQVLKSELIKYHFNISGQDYVRLIRYILISILRTKNGFILKEDEAFVMPRESVVYSFIKTISTLCQYQFSQAEILEIHKLLYHSDRLMSFNDLDPLLIEKIDALEQFIIKKLNLKTSQLFDHKERFTTYVSQMLMRLNDGQKIINYKDLKVVERYLLEIYLMDIGFHHIFSITIPKSELFFLGTYLAGCLYPYKTEIRVLLITNQVFPMYFNIESIFKNIFSFHVKAFDVVPAYQYKKNDEQDYDLCLTTETEIGLANDKIILAPIFLEMNDQTILYELIYDWCKKYQQKRSNNIKKTYLVVETKDSLNLLLDDIDEKSKKYIYKNKLLICQIEAHIDSVIKCIRLKKSYLYHHQDIKEVILIHYDQTQKDILPFFQVTSTILK